MKRICRYIPLLVVLLGCIPLMHAQAGFDIAVGFGAAQAKKAGGGLDANLNNCAPPNGSTCVETESLHGFNMGVQGNLMLWKHFGVGAELTTQPAKQDYADLQSSAGYKIQSRTTFYDFNGIIQPYRSKVAAIQLIGGFGGANLKFYATGSNNSALGNQNFSQYFVSSNHFQLHGGAGVTIYVKEHIFIRPEFDIHYVHNLNQFGNNLVTQEMVWVGFTLGQ